MMGYVIIVSKTGMFSAAEQQIIPLLSSSAKERIVRSNNGNWIDYRASQLNNIFADMLAGAQNVDMERRMKLAKLSFPEQKCLAIIRPVYYKEPAYYNPASFRICRPSSARRPFRWSRTIWCCC